MAFVGSQLGQIFQRNGKRHMPFPTGKARCQVSASKYRIMRDLVKSWLLENFNRQNSLLGDI